jgi:hypothetical protein
MGSESEALQTIVLDSISLFKRHNPASETLKLPFKTLSTPSAL